MKNKLLILSGGMDSTVALYEFQNAIGLAVTFNYGSKHNEEETKKAADSCHRLAIPHIVVNLENAFKDFKSDLLKTGGDIPEGHYADENMSKTVVPFRNGIMLAVATGLAESYNLDTVMLASHAGDHAIYPDCRPDFNRAMDLAMKLGTAKGIQLWSPYGQLTKEEIANHGELLGVKWSNTYSCYKGGKVHCGVCSTCAERLWALRHLDDDTEYLDYDTWKTYFTEKELA